MSDQEHQDLRERTRKALRTAMGHGDPDLSRIVSRVPAIVTEARRRRSREAELDPLSAVFLLARKAIPTMAAAAAVLVAIAVFVGRSEPAGSIDSATGAESFLLTGEAGEGVNDLLLQAMTQGRGDNG